MSLEKRGGNTGNADMCNAPSRPDANAKYGREREEPCKPQLASLAQSETNKIATKTSNHANRKIKQRISRQGIYHIKCQDLDSYK